VKKTEAVKQKGNGSDMVDLEAGDCEDDRSAGADRKGEG
jgi:hypothetical protein